MAYKFNPYTGTFEIQTPSSASSATSVPLVTTNFNQLLSPTENNVQLAFDALDDHQHSTGMTSLVTITDNGNQTITVSSGEVVAYTTTDWIGSIKKYTVPSKILTVADFSLPNYLYVEISSGTASYKITTTASLINSSNRIAVALCHLSGSAVHSMRLDSAKATSTRILNRLTVGSDRFKWVSGLTLSESTGRIVKISSGVAYFGINRPNLTATNSSDVGLDFWYRVAGSWNRTTISTYNNTQYDDGTNLVELQNDSKFGINWIYRCFSDFESVAYVLGKGSYGSISEAVQEPIPTNLPDAIRLNMILVGRIIFQKNSSSAAKIESAFTQVFASVPINNHNDLYGTEDVNAHPASSISFDYTVSGLIALDVQGAIDSIVSNVSSNNLLITSQINSLSGAITSHTHTMSAITDSSTIGRALLSATSASAARTTLQLGSAATQPSIAFAPFNTYTTVNALSANWNIAYSSFRSVTADTTLSPSTDKTLGCIGNITVLLPQASSGLGIIFNIKNMGTGIITLSASTPQLIEDENPQYIYSGENFTIQSTGTTWMIL